jgi:uncharacterized damage-inducible protein DinB
MVNQPEMWLRGPVSGVSPRLQPAAHALLQTVEDVERAVEGLTPDQVWTSPGGAASIGFHVLHLAGATDRLFTYARGESLSDLQKAQLLAEKSPPRADIAALVAALRQAVEAALAQLRTTSDATLDEPRAIGRAALPTTVLGLLFHTAEHAQRHAGQVVTTGKVIRGLGVIPATPSGSGPM